MNRAGGIIGMVAGVFAVIGAIVTLMVGGLGSAFKADNADTVVALGWGGIAFSFLVIVSGAVALFKPKSAGIALIVCSLGGAVLGGTIVAVFMVLSLIGGIVCVIGDRQKKDTNGAVQQHLESAPGPPAVEAYVATGEVGRPEPSRTNWPSKQAWDASRLSLMTSLPFGSSSAPFCNGSTSRPSRLETVPTVFGSSRNLETRLL